MDGHGAYYVFYTEYNYSVTSPALSAMIANMLVQ